MLNDGNAGPSATLALLASVGMTKIVLVSQSWFGSDGDLSAVVRIDSGGDNRGNVRLEKSLASVPGRLD